MVKTAAPQPGDFAAMVVGLPGPDIDYALCIERNGDKALLRFQVWQKPGPWHETWTPVTGHDRYGCWKVEGLDKIGKALHEERDRLFPQGAYS